MASAETGGSLMDDQEGEGVTEQGFMTCTRHGRQPAKVTNYYRRGDPTPIPIDECPVCEGEADAEVASLLADLGKRARHD